MFPWKQFGYIVACSFTYTMVSVHFLKNVLIITYNYVQIFMNLWYSTLWTGCTVANLGIPQEASQPACISSLTAFVDQCFSACLVYSIVKFDYFVFLCLICGILTHNYIFIFADCQQKYTAYSAA